MTTVVTSEPVDLSPGKISDSKPLTPPSRFVDEDEDVDESDSTADERGGDEACEDGKENSEEGTDKDDDVEKEDRSVVSVSVGSKVLRAVELPYCRLMCRGK